MSVQKALLSELFAILLVLYGGFTVIAPYQTGHPSFIHAGFYLGLFGFLYGLVGTEILRTSRNDT
ncbi:hypothetical protein [Haloarchaeobius salinus]|uniref:hypothetical protein n=1 Tax=Haloarchaeobius salinus TaxID=1198298 RepID=UPI00210ED902|nr:hypothetical protein [Haloarchaeobius salinus]